MAPTRIRMPTTATRRRIRRMMPAVADRPTRYVRAVEELLLAWFAEHGRDLPWRATRDPYAILVSEGMSQQYRAINAELCEQDRLFERVVVHCLPRVGLPGERVVKRRPRLGSRSPLIE